MNQIVINFDECVPAPSMGYRVWWRVAGSGDPLTNEGDFFTSPAVFTDNTNPPGTEYEGYVASNCRGGLGTPQFWSTIESSGSSGGSSGGVDDEFSYYLADEYSCPDCDFPVRTDIIVRLPASHVVQIGKYYKATPNIGFAYQINSTELQPPSFPVILTGENYTTCGVICGG